MLTKLKLIIIGGDHRQVEIAKMIANKGGAVSMVGFEQLADEQIDQMKIGFQEVDVRKVDAILFPVGGVNDTGKVESAYSDKSMLITKELFAKTREDCVIYTGIITPSLKQLADVTNRKLVALFERDDLAIYNSIPTAEGALKLAIEHTDFTIHGSNVTVLGYGRVGKTIARVFSAVGANVRVGVRKAADMARVSEVGLKAFHLNNLEKEVSNVDICINTIPYLILSKPILVNMCSHSLIIDLASKPGGTDFQFAKEKGLKVLWALGLPGKVAPRTAGELIGHVLTDLLQEQLSALSEKEKDCF
ncbi:dipicolinate synthase subunit DpsA [Bacillus sp. B15-48]|uniref:dipicolinate synthase subunit DpsA n=1 Tax=Bacillus sp. B15-48 TaxID=1548601 RepID=UPI001940081A|nr:dipicolinate synthase subunit DpsA [Bacillus sp. B15-48]MBM4763538.1 dipicolinate synthase subunit DpsA [Bacillus sp. B15-48]